MNMRSKLAEEVINSKGNKKYAGGKSMGGLGRILAIAIFVILFLLTPSVYAIECFDSTTGEPVPGGCDVDPRITIQRELEPAPLMATAPLGAGESTRTQLNDMLDLNNPNFKFKEVGISGGSHWNYERGDMSVDIFLYNRRDYNENEKDRTVRIEIPKNAVLNSASFDLTKIEFTSNEEEWRGMIVDFSEGVDDDWNSPVGIGGVAGTGQLIETYEIPKGQIDSAVIRFHGKGSRSYPLRLEYGCGSWQEIGYNYVSGWGDYEIDLPNLCPYGEFDLKWTIIKDHYGESSFAEAEVVWNGTFGEEVFSLKVGDGAVELSRTDEQQLTTTNLVDSINENLPECDCTGCELTDDICSLPLNFHFNDSNWLTMDMKNIEMNYSVPLDAELANTWDCKAEETFEAGETTCVLANETTINSNPANPIGINGIKVPVDAAWCNVNKENQTLSGGTCQYNTEISTSGDITPITIYTDKNYNGMPVGKDEGDDEQDKGKTTVAGGIAYIKRAVELITMGKTDLSFSGTWSVNERDGWDCEACANQPFTVKDGENKSKTAFMSKPNTITKTPKTRLQDTTKKSNLSVQFAKQEFIINNTETLEFKGVYWSTTLDWGDCDNCEGNLNLSSEETITVTATWHGNALNATWSGWHQVENVEINLSKQQVQNTLVAKNKDTEITFINTSWSKEGPEGFNCTNCEGSINIAPSSDTLETASAGGDVLIDSMTEWKQDDTKQTVAGGFAYSRKDLSIYNNASISFTNVKVEDQELPSWECIDLEDQIDIEEKSWHNRSYTCNYTNVITKNESGWAQDTGRESNTSVQYVKEIISGENTDKLDYEGVQWSVNVPGEYETLETSGEFDIKAKEDWEKTATAKGNRIEQVESTWEEDTTHENTLSSQKLKKKVTLKNKDENIDFSNISWSSTCKDDAIACEGNKGKSREIPAQDNWTATIEMTEDRLEEGFMGWAENQVYSHTLGTQGIKRTMHVMNYDNITFTNVYWENTSTLDDFECIECIGRTDFPAEELKYLQLNATGDILEEDWSNWAQDNTSSTEAGGMAHIKKALNVYNNGSVDFQEVDIGTLQREGWWCQVFQPSINVGAEEWMNHSRVVACAKEAIVQKEVSNWESKSDVVRINSVVSVSKKVKINNTDDLVEFAPKITAQLPEALEGTILLVNGNDTTPLEIDNKTGVVEWDSPIMPREETTFELIYSAEGPKLEENTTLTSKGREYEYKRKLNVPNNYSSNSDIIIEINTSELDKWGQRKEELIRVDGKEVSTYEENGSTLTIVIPKDFTKEGILATLKHIIRAEAPKEHSFLVGMYDVIVDYTLPPKKREGGGGGGGSSSTTPTVIEEKEEALEEGESVPKKSAPTDEGEKYYPPTKEKTPEPVVERVEPSEEEGIPLFQSIRDAVKDAPTALVTMLGSKSALTMLLGASILAALSVLYIYRHDMPALKLPKLGNREEKPVTQDPTPNTQHPPVEEPKVKISTRQEAILGSLHPKAREILETVVEKVNENPRDETSQAKVYHTTGIPTTSISRWVSVLEQRGLIETYKIGKLRRIKLTEKFMKD